MATGLLVMQMGHRLCSIEHGSASKRDDRLGPKTQAGIETGANTDIGNVRRQVIEAADALLDVRLDVFPVQRLQRLDREGDRSFDAVLAEKRDGARQDVPAPKDRVLRQANRMVHSSDSELVSMGLQPSGETISAW
jgi:hypothetical protein